MRISDCSSDVCSSDLLEGGVSFGDCVAGWVPERDRHLISAGAKSNLSKALRNAAQMETGMKKIKSSILAAMAYPMALVLGVIGIMVYFNKSLAPVIESAVPKSNWTGSLARSGERRGGNGGARTCRSRWWPYN